jgi:hypothetical protein
MQISVFVTNYTSKMLKVLAKNVTVLVPHVTELTRTIVRLAMLLVILEKRTHRMSAFVKLVTLMMVFHPFVRRVVLPVLLGNLININLKD